MDDGWMDDFSWFSVVYLPECRNVGLIHHERFNIIFNSLFTIIQSFGSKSVVLRYYKHNKNNEQIQFVDTLNDFIHI
jgi:hypothetical protein